MAPCRQRRRCRLYLALRVVSHGLVAWVILLALPACRHRPGTVEVRPESAVGGAAASVGTPAASAATGTSPFTGVPLLLRAELDAVRGAIEQEDDERAIAALRSVISRDRSFHPEECHYLLGILSERTGAANEAVRSFEIAARQPWPLQHDAAVHLVRLALNQKECARADALLAPLVSGGKEQPTIVELLARSDLCSGHWQKAAERLRWLIASSNDDARRPGWQLLLARAILQQLRNGQLHDEPAAQQAADLVRDAIQHAASAETVLQDANRVLGDLLTLPEGESTGVESSNARVTLLEALVEARRWPEAKALSKELLAQIVPSERETLRYCRVAFASGRIAAARSDPQAAEESFKWVGEHCEDEDLAARAVFLWAGQLLSTKRRADAILAYAELERRFPAHRLADDARLKQALVHRAMGAEERFVTLLESIYVVYPKGDMVPEALFQLALKRMAERNWSEALSVLQRARDIHKTLGRVRSLDVERTQYFLGRALVASGRVDAGIEQMRELIARRPLSYYMLLSYSALVRIQPELARPVLLAAADSSPGALADSDSTSRPGERDVVERITTLLGVGDVQAAELELYEPGAKSIGRSAALAIAGTFANVAATNSALALVKKLGIDCRDRWPNAGWNEIWRQSYPRPHLELVRREAARTSVPESLLYAIMREESEFDPKAVSVASAFGLMQLIVPTARTVARELGIAATPRSLLKPSINITLGASFLRQLMERFDRQIALVAAGYNAGPGRPVRWLRENANVDSDLWIELIEYPETRNYVKRVLESNATYGWLYAADSESARIEVVPERWVIR